MVQTFKKLLKFLHFNEETTENKFTVSCPDCKRHIYYSDGSGGCDFGSSISKACIYNGFAFREPIDE